MLVRSMAFCFLVIFLFCEFSHCQEAKPDPREKIETAVAEAIRLLEAKEYGALLKAFVPPEDLKKFTERGGFEELESQFAKSNAPELLEILKSIKGSTPKMENEGKKAVFQFKEPRNGKKSITFNKIDKYWYIQNSE